MHSHRTNLNCSYSDLGRNVKSVYFAVLVLLELKPFLHAPSLLLVKIVLTSFPFAAILEAERMDWSLLLDFFSRSAMISISLSFVHLLC